MGSRGKSSAFGQLDSVFDYFYHLDEKFGSMRTFRRNWQKIPQQAFNSKKLVNILHKTAAHLKRSRNQTRVQNIKEHIAQNLQAWEGPAKDRIDSFNAQDLALSLWAHASLGIRPSPEFMAAWENQAIDIIDTFNSQNLANSLWAYASLGIQPSPEFMAAWENQIAGKIDEFKRQELGNSLWACAVLASMRIDTKDVAQNLYKKLKGSPGSSRRNSQFTQACLWFDFPFERDVPDEPNRKGKAEGLLIDALNKAGIPAGQGRMLDALNHRVDVDFNTGRRKTKPVLVEVDGPSHFVYSAGGAREYNGSTLFQSALITKLAISAVLLRLPYTVTNAIFAQAPAQQTALLKNLEKRARRQTRGTSRKVELQGQALKLEPLEASIS